MGKPPRPEHPVSMWEATGGSDHGEEMTEASQGARRLVGHPQQGAVPPGHRRGETHAQNHLRA